jgi:hypothetical protein
VLPFQPPPRRANPPRTSHARRHSRASLGVGCFNGIAIFFFDGTYKIDRPSLHAEQSTPSSNSNGETYNLPNSDEKEKVVSVVGDKFSNGFRISSNIDFERFKNYYESAYNEEFPYSMDRLDSILSSVAVVFDDRAYVYDDEVVASVRACLEQMDSPCVDLEIFFEKHSGELYTFGIFSIDMLKAFLEKSYADIFIRYSYIYLRPDASPTDMIRRAFNEREVWSYDELSARLPGIKMDTIRQTLNRDEYFRVETGTYTHMDNIDLPDGKGREIAALVAEKMHTRDYVIANELDFSVFENLNPHCPFSAIRDAVFVKFLSSEYDKRGQVITRKGKPLRVLDILEQYCRDAETASFEELNAFEATFDPDGRTHSQCLIAAHNTMVRVSDTLFVADSKVHFDIEKIDEAIVLYCRGEFTPLKNVVDFSLFPYAGYPWNLFLLESYVRKYSRVFKFDVRSVNSANIGVIARRTFKYDDYDDILAIAVAQSSLSLGDTKAIADFLFNNGYIGWRNLGKSEEKILAQAKKLREGGVI